jgi:hypothetical protein
VTWHTERHGGERLLDRYTAKPAELTPGGSSSSGALADAATSEVPDDLGCFGWLRGVKDRAVMLELHRRTGDIVAVGYAWIERIEFDPSEGLHIFALGKDIHITGQRLGHELRPGVSLLGGLCRHRVPWIREAQSHEIPGALNSGTDAVVVDQIKLR